MLVDHNKFMLQIIGYLLMVSIGISCVRLLLCMQLIHWQSYLNIYKLLFQFKYIECSL